MALYNCNTYFSLNKTKENLKKGNIDSSFHYYAISQYQGNNMHKICYCISLQNRAKIATKGSKEKAAQPILTLVLFHILISAFKVTNFLAYQIFVSVIKSTSVSGFMRVVLSFMQAIFDLWGILCTDRLLDVFCKVGAKMLEMR